MWYRASHARRLWQTEHTAGGIQEWKNERGSRGGNHLKGWMLVVPNVRGVLVPNIFGSMGCDCGPLQRIFFAPSDDPIREVQQVL